MYVAYFEDSKIDESEPLAILRINVPIGDSVPDAPEYDVRKCTLDDMVQLILIQMFQLG